VFEGAAPEQAIRDVSLDYSEDLSVTITKSS
jgi:hypothetical protein